MSKVDYATDILIYSIDSRKNENSRGLPKKYFSILLVKRTKEPFKDMWCLPGGYVLEDETSYEAAKRILKKETNISACYMEQLSVFDDVKRDPRCRTISTTYISLIDKTKLKEDLNEYAKWFDIYIDEDDDLIKIHLENEDVIDINILRTYINKQAEQYEYILKYSNNIAFDHGLIINKGILELRNKANTTDIIFNLMPKLFTIGELKQVYEIILGKSLVNSAFRRVIAPKIKKSKEIIKTGGHRPSNLYEYKNIK